MTETLPRHYIFGIIMFTFIIVGGVSLLTTLRESDSSFASDSRFGEFNKSFNKMEEVTGEVGTLKSSITGSDPEWGLFGVLNALIMGVWQAIKLIFTGLDFMTTAFFGLTTVFGVPSWVGGLIMLFISVILIFTIWSIIFQKEI